MAALHQAPAEAHLDFYRRRIRIVIKLPAFLGGASAKGAEFDLHAGGLNLQFLSASTVAVSATVQIGTLSRHCRIGIRRNAGYLAGGNGAVSLDINRL